MRTSVVESLLVASIVVFGAPACSSSGDDASASGDDVGSSGDDTRDGDGGVGDTRSSAEDSARIDTATSDAPGVDGATDAIDAAPARTKGSVVLKSGWMLKTSDRFGTDASQNVRTVGDLHAKYYEAQYYNRDAKGLARIPNVVINHEQETYSHFEDVIAFASDHLTIQARGKADGSISSGEIVSRPIGRSYCVEARYQIPNVDKAWPAFWLYGDIDGHDASEIDVEQPVYADNKGSHQDAHQVSLYNHPDQGTLTIVDSKFTSTWMTWTNPAFDGSTAPHVYTICYDDAASLLTRYIDGAEIYSSVWKWNASLGGTGHGPDPSVVVNLAVGGDWPGNVPTPSTYAAGLDLYWIDTYGP